MFKKWKQLGFKVQCLFDESGMQIFGYWSNGQHGLFDCTWTDQGAYEEILASTGPEFAQIIDLKGRVDAEVERWAEHAREEAAWAAETEDLILNVVTFNHVGERVTLIPHHIDFDWDNTSPEERAAIILKEANDRCFNDGNGYCESVMFRDDHSRYYEITDKIPFGLAELIADGAVTVE